MVELKEDKKIEKGTRRLLEMKQQRKRGRVSFYLDGSGNVSELEIVEKE